MELELHEARGVLVGIGRAEPQAAWRCAVSPPPPPCQLGQQANGGPEQSERAHSRTCMRGAGGGVEFEPGSPPGTAKGHLDPATSETEG